MTTRETPYARTRKVYVRAPVGTGAVHVSRVMGAAGAGMDAPGAVPGARLADNEVTDHG